MAATPSPWLLAGSESGHDQHMGTIWVGSCRPGRAWHPSPWHGACPRFGFLRLPAGREGRGAGRAGSRLSCGPAFPDSFQKAGQVGEPDSIPPAAGLLPTSSPASQCSLQAPPCSVLWASVIPGHLPWLTPSRPPLLPPLLCLRQGQLSMSRYAVQAGPELPSAVMTDSICGSGDST